ncbi:MAG: AI-2E family transporter [Deltaproteobacteria bacterium]|nr:AI-2E family transporter [Deltaproteobacteria bacterium]
MKKEWLFNLLFLALVIMAFYLFFRILSPFFSIFAWAAILTIIFYPLFKIVNRLYGNRRVWAALTMTIAVIIAIIIPAGFLLNIVAKELLDIYQYCEQLIKEGKHITFFQGLQQIGLVQRLTELLDRYFDLSQIDLETFLLDNLQKLNMYVAGQAPKFIKGISAIILKFLLMTVTLFFFFKDGEEVLTKIKALIPLTAKERDNILKKVVEMIQATIYGGIVVALVQGGMGTLGFVIVGLGAPLFWGTVMALLSFMHIVGPFMVWVPATVFLLIQGAYAKAAILGIWGAILVSLSDNFLRPIIISGRTQVHPLLVFFSTLGGLYVFGLVGFIAGPLVITICLAIIDIYTAPPRRRGR